MLIEERKGTEWIGMDWRGLEGSGADWRGMERNPKWN
jgi:hypothetical protein